MASAPTTPPFVDANTAQLDTNSRRPRKRIAPTLVKRIAPTLVSDVPTTPTPVDDASTASTVVEDALTTPTPMEDASTASTPVEDAPTTPTPVEAASNAPNLVEDASTAGDTLDDPDSYLIPLKELLDLPPPPSAPPSARLSHESVQKGADSGFGVSEKMKGKQGEGKVKKDNNAGGEKANEDNKMKRTHDSDIEVEDEPQKKKQRQHEETDDKEESDGTGDEIQVAFKPQLRRSERNKTKVTHYRG